MRGYQKSQQLPQTADYSGQLSGVLEALKDRRSDCTGRVGLPSMKVTLGDKISTWKPRECRKGECMGKVKHGLNTNTVRETRPRLAVMRLGRMVEDRKAARETLHGHRGDTAQEEHRHEMESREPFLLSAQ